MFCRNPKRIFNILEQLNTYVEVDLHEAMAFAKSKGTEIPGSVHQVVLRDDVANIKEQVLVNPGYGLDILEVQKKVKIVSPIIHPAITEITSRPNSAFKRYVSPNRRWNFDNEEETIRDAFVHLLYPPPKSNVHFTQEYTPGQRVASPTSFNRTTRYKSDHNPNMVIQVLIQQPLPATNYGLTGQHILSIDIFKKEQLKDIFDIAHDLRKSTMAVRSLDHILRGKVMASMFYEVSTRTSCSFDAAMERLGGRVIHMDIMKSSVKKGETLEDSVTIMAGYADVVVLRHSECGAANTAAMRCRKPLINASDDVGEHPTQALLDFFTIREEIGTVRGLTVTMVGDLKHGWTVHSLAKLLALYENVQLRYVSPPNLGIPDEIVKYVANKGILQEKYNRLEDVLAEMDILYVTRIQRERFATQEEYDKACGHFVVTPQLMTRAKSKMRVMHPLPRVFEISPEFDNDPRAAYFRQAENGV